METQRGISRRDALKLGAVAAAGAVVAGRPGTGAADDTYTLTAFIPGAPEASRNIQAVEIGTLTVRSQAQEAGLSEIGFDSDALQSPAGASWSKTRFTFLVPASGQNADLDAWFANAAAGARDARDITVALHSSTGGSVWEYNLLGCEPVELSGPTFDVAAGPIKVLVVTVRWVEPA